MKVFGLAGWSGSGKTTLMVKLLPELTGRGLTVSTMKHAHHNFDVDTPGKDSYEHRRAGATEVLVTSANRWALMHELRGAPEPDMDALIAHMSPVDLLLIEGFKHYSHDKMLIHRADNRKGLPIAPDDPTVVAVATDSDLPDAGEKPVLDLDDVPAIADFIVAHCGLEGRRT